MTAATAVGRRLARVERGTGAELLERLFRVLLPDARTVLDATFGNGKFWDGRLPLSVVGVDINPARARDVCADFTRLPFRDGAFDVTIFDPPYVTEAGNDGLIGRRFGSYPTIADLRAAVQAGAQEAWRVSRIGVVVKVMDYVHASRLVRMSRWVEDAIPADLYDVAYLESRSKLEDPKWSRAGGQLSVRSTATTWLVWRKDGAVHKRRKLAAG